MKNLFILICLAIVFTTNAQVAINTDDTPPNNSAMLDIKSTSKGLLPPRMTNAELNAITDPADGLIVYCTDCGTNGLGLLAMFMAGAWYSFSANFMSYNYVDITSCSATNVTQQSAQLNCTINPNSLSTSVIFEYGITPSFGDSIIGSPSVVSGIAPSSVTANLSGLLSDQNYYYRVKASNFSGTYYSPINSFQTFSSYWNMQTEFSIVNNPNGVWSYGRKWSADTDGFDLMPYIYNNTFWLLGPGIWYPSIQAGVDLWANNNNRGLPCVRWTCPADGVYSLTSTFTGADYNGVDVIVYISKNGVILFSDQIQAFNETVEFSFTNVMFLANEHLDFSIQWNYGVTADHNWTIVSAIITE